MTEKEATGAIAILAYPEEFVSMIPAWYRKPLEWIGMVRNGKVRAGHAAMALIEKSTGAIHYADFGRYITPFGYGRTRMTETDPELNFNFRAEFDKEGKIVNKFELFQYIYNHPEKTHGGPVMFVSLNQKIDFNSCYSFITDMNQKGSILYNPFGSNASNCSRFVFDAILAGVKEKSQQRKLKRMSPVTSSPLGNVFHGSAEMSYEFTEDGYTEVTDTSILRVLTTLLKKPEEKRKLINNIPKAPINSSWHFLGGVGDQAYFEQNGFDKNHIEFSKYGKDLKLTFIRRYRLVEGFNPNEIPQLIIGKNLKGFEIDERAAQLAG